MLSPQKKTRIVIIGIGAVGSTTAYTLLLRHRMDELVLIDANKEKAIADVFERYADDEIFLIDDALPVLYALKKEYPQVFTIWMKRGRYATKQEPIGDFVPEKTVLHLYETVEIIRKA